MSVKCSAVQDTILALVHPTKTVTNKLFSVMTVMKQLSYLRKHTFMSVSKIRGK